MKQTRTLIALVLSLVMMLSLAACGNAEVKDPEPTGSSQVEATTEQAPADDTTEVPEEPTTSEQPESSEETVEETTTEPALSTWPNNKFEELIPEPPLTGWVGTEVTGTIYELALTEFDPETAFAAIKDYTDLLATNGYEITVGGRENFYSASNDECHIEIQCTNTSIIIAIYTL